MGHFRKKPGVTVCASTICWLLRCLQGSDIPLPTTAAPLRAKKDSPGFREHFPERAEVSGDRQIIQRSHPGSGRGTLWRPPWGHHRDAL